MTAPLLLPATTLALAVDADGPLCGIALLGPPGAGKSQTAMSLMTQCAHRRSRLISDDMSWLGVKDDRLVASAPAGMAGRIELRGTGISVVPAIERFPLSFAFRMGLTTERQPADPAPWAPLGEHGPTLPEFHWTHGRAGLIVFVRSILSGHSRRAGFDYMPAAADEG